MGKFGFCLHMFSETGFNQKLEHHQLNKIRLDYPKPKLPHINNNRACAQHCRNSNQHTGHQFTHSDAAYSHKRARTRQQARPSSGLFKPSCWPFVDNTNFPRNICLQFLPKTSEITCYCLRAAQAPFSSKAWRSFWSGNTRQHVSSPRYSWSRGNRIINLWSVLSKS